MQLLIPVQTGAEAPVKRQLYRMGLGDCPAERGRIRLEGDWDTVARLNVMLRAGERVLVELGSFPVHTFDELFEGVRSLPFEEFLDHRAKILIDGKCVESELMAIKACGGVVKKAVLTRLKEKLGSKTFDEKGGRATVGVSIYRNTASITLDTTGEGLHKRGYRVKTYDAPLRETTAAALFDLTHFHPESPFADLFCGSGTIPIEAALLARNVAPNKNRDFDFTGFRGVPKTALNRAREEALSGERQVKTQIFASDISPRAIEIARFHAARAGVERDIRFSVADVKEFTSSQGYGVLLSNPPYGERLKEGDLFGLYQSFGRTFRSLHTWSGYFITSYEGAERAFGGKPQKKRRFYNAGLACTFFSYEGPKPPSRLLGL